MSKIRRLEEQNVSERQAVQNGPGFMIGRSLIEGDTDMWNKGRLLSLNTLKKDCGVGYHVHQGDGEIYYIISGEAEYDDNGTITTVKAGDVTFTGPGEGHAITNRGDEDVQFLAIILYE